MSRYQRRISRGALQIVCSPVTSTPSGATVSFQGSIKTNRTFRFDGLNISIAQDTTGYPWVASTAISNGQTTNGTYTLSGSLSNLASGNYVAYVSYSTDGQQSWRTGTKTTFSVSPSTVPNAPFISISAYTTSTISLAWSPPTQPNGTIQSYNIGWTSASGLPQPSWSGNYPNPSNPFVLTNLAANSSYDIWMEAVNENGTGAQSTITQSTAAVNGGSYPTSVVAVYKKIWSSNTAVTATPANATEVRLSFAQGDPPTLTGYTSTGQSSFVNSLAQRRQAGQLIILSVGGAGGNVNTANRANFLQGVANAKALLESASGGGLDGIDWDIEVGSSFPTSDAIAISTDLKNLYGSQFAITMAPNGTNKLAYRTAAVQMHSQGCLDWMGQQFYDANVSLAAAKSEIQNSINAGLPAEKVGVGMYVSNDPNIGWTLAQCQSYLQDIRNTWPQISRVYAWMEDGDTSNVASWTTSMRSVLGI